jgi:4'-phosphopantetheinyl transferase
LPTPHPSPETLPDRGQDAASRRGVRLWTLDLEGLASPPAAWLELLDAEERGRSQRFRRDADRLAYVAAHALLRRILGQALGRAPAALVWARDALGRPFLAHPQGLGVEFSLSHTEGMVAVALNPAGKVGVDVEALDRRAPSEREYPAFGLSPDELALLATAPEPRRADLFFDLWTAREAVAKADGRGLSLPFDRIRIDRATDQALLAGDGSLPDLRWRLWRECPSPRHRLALAWPEGGGSLVQIVRVDPLG